MTSGTIVIVPVSVVPPSTGGTLAEVPVNIVPSRVVNLAFTLISPRIVGTSGMVKVPSAPVIAVKPPTVSTSAPSMGSPTPSTTLPMTHPEPDIRFEGSTFSLTGRFVFGTKQECEEAIEDLGGMVVPAPTTETDYLVIGELGSPDWVHSTFGRSIEKTVELNEHGHDIAIVSEEHWVNQL